MSGRVGDADRIIYRALADCLLPASDAMPAASDVMVAGEMLDKVLEWRPDIAPDLLRGVAASRDVEPAAALDGLQVADPDAYRAIRTAALGAYFMAPAVRAALGYGGQQSRPVSVDETPDYFVPGLLDPVRGRGPIYRTTDR